MPMQARRGGIAPTHLQPGTRGRWVVGTTFRVSCTGRDLVGGPRSRSGRTENLVSTGIRTPDHPARNVTPYRICYPGRHFINPLKPELNPICYLLALLGAHHFLHVSRIRVKLLTFRRLMSYIYIWSTHS